MNVPLPLPTVPLLIALDTELDRFRWGAVDEDGRELLFFPGAADFGVSGL